jgi:DNA repair photolyase
MIDTLYVEEELARHPRLSEIRGKFPRALEVPIRKYGEIFNPNAQSFRLQKKNPSLVLARKRGRYLHEAPYGVGGARNYYFSHVLNCLYDCRYCFLQGMYRSAHYVLFVNYEDFQSAILETGEQFPDEDVYFFSGYDGDSLVLEPVTGFLEAFLPFFARNPRLVLELRTKSVAIRPLLATEAFPNCVAAFSFTPEPIRERLEHGVPRVEQRIAAARKLAERGWPIGLRFDPLVYVPDYRDLYLRLFEEVFASIPRESLHSVGFGAFRLPRDYFHRMEKLYPDERLFAASLEEREGMISYPAALEKELLEFCKEALSDHAPTERLFAY